MHSCYFWQVILCQCRGSGAVGEERRWGKIRTGKQDLCRNTQLRLCCHNSVFGCLNNKHQTSYEPVIYQMAYISGNGCIFPSVLSPFWSCQSAVMSSPFLLVRAPCSLLKSSAKSIWILSMLNREGMYALKHPCVSWVPVPWRKQALKHSSLVPCLSTHADAPSSWRQPDPDRHSAPGDASGALFCRLLEG